MISGGSVGEATGPPAAPEESESSASSRTGRRRCERKRKEDVQALEGLWRGDLVHEVTLQREGRSVASQRRAGLAYGGLGPATGGLPTHTTDLSGRDARQCRAASRRSPR